MPNKRRAAETSLVVVDASFLAPGEGSLSPTVSEEVATGVEGYAESPAQFSKGLSWHN
jgi:hypothetical protein